MPEIPEIETIRQHLANTVIDKKISKTIVNREKTINLPSNEFKILTEQQIITAVQRRAKLLILSLSNGYSLVFHFMLEGYIKFYKPSETVPDKAHIIVIFETNEKLAFFKMNLGYLHLVPTPTLTDIKEIANLGPEPLSEDFTLAAFSAALTKHRGMLKPLLMDQSFIAGIGNVYSNEILFCAKLMPTAKVSQLTSKDIAHLFICIKNVLQTALANGGVLDESFASDDTLTGGHTPHLKVAYRTGQPCYLCGHPIQSKKVGGRNAFFCPVCQRPSS